MHEICKHYCRNFLIKTFARRRRRRRRCCKRYWIIFYDIPKKEKALNFSLLGISISFIIPFLILYHPPYSVAKRKHLIKACPLQSKYYHLYQNINDVYPSCDTPSFQTRNESIYRTQGNFFCLSQPRHPYTFFWLDSAKKVNFLPRALVFRSWQISRKVIRQHSCAKSGQKAQRRDTRESRSSWKVARNSLRLGNTCGKIY